ncbi:antibiotic biosynthesis monooxygenase family protein [Pseudalkalibacillus sp. Hm43]|uniref:antibiotic biosynthesis monooxygenase family protein n=1 Tax=Pseudalkalibacillus sp. Hm43 TaxID=3450742 RepID=UPI003F426782
MNYHIAYGTEDFLESLLEKYQNEEGNFYLLDGPEESILIHRTTGESLFESGHSYEAIEESGGFDGANFVVFNNIPVSSEGRPVFEDRFKQRAGLVENEPGCAGIIILRPKDTDTYIVSSMWHEEKDFEAWKESSSYEKAHKGRGTSEGLPQTIFTGKPYIKSFHVQQKVEK